MEQISLDDDTITLILSFAWRWMNPNRIFVSKRWNRLARNASIREDYMRLDNSAIIKGLPYLKYLSIEEPRLEQFTVPKTVTHFHCAYTDNCEIILHNNIIELTLRECTNIKELTTPTNCKYLNTPGCSVLNKLMLNSGIEEVVCTSNNLTELDVPKGCKVLKCADNNIQTLIVPESCTYVMVARNPGIVLHINSDKTVIGL